MFLCTEMIKQGQIILFDFLAKALQYLGRGIDWRTEAYHNSSLYEDTEENYSKNN